LAVRKNIMSNQLKFVLIAAATAMGMVSPALAQSFSFPTYAYLHPQTNSHNYGTAHAGRLYNNVSGQDEQAAWPSAAAMGNSH
jgi:hypothetical protein